MRAVQFHAWGSAPTLDEVPDPVLVEGETLVRVEAAPIGHLDLTIASGSFGITPDLPHIGGTGCVGRVVASPDYAPGTRVLVRGAGIGTTRAGCWADLVAVPPTGLTTIEHDLPAEVAASFTLPTSTGCVAVHDVGRVCSGERVLVSGASGSVGSVATQLALRAGADVIAVVPHERHRDLVHERAEVLVGRGAQLAAALKDLEPVDLVVDTLGGDVLAPILKAVRPGGRAVLVGYTLGTELPLDLPNWLLTDVALLPVNMMRRSARTAELLPELVGLLRSGELHIEVETAPLEQAAQTLERMAAGEVRGRAVLVPQ